jgi:hypothetical protein
MSCEEVEAKLSLYVAGDVERQDVRESLDAHLRGCEPCRAQAAAWKSSREMLHLDAPPEFDAVFFDSIRRDVMRQISEAPPSIFARMLGQHFGQRALVYATAFSVLVCAVAVSMHLQRRSHLPDVSVAKKDRAGTVGNSQTDIIRKSASTEHGGSTSKDLVESSVPKPTATPRRRVRPSSASTQGAARGEKFATPQQEPDDEQVASLPGVRGGSDVRVTREPSATGAASQNPSETAAADRKMLRIELQTSDPNIRIIWLSPEATDRASSNKLTERR